MLTKRNGPELDATKVSEFQDWCLKPLGHPSILPHQASVYIRRPLEATFRIDLAEEANSLAHHFVPGVFIVVEQ
jgi:hypothetical protein